MFRGILVRCVLGATNSVKGYALGNTCGKSTPLRCNFSSDVLHPPNGHWKLVTPPPPSSTGEKFSGYIPMNQLEVSYSRSSGPGGQHVNCVNTKVGLRFKLAEANWIPEKTKNKLFVELRNKITKDGYFIVKSDLTRSQQMNLADALEKLRNIIRKYEIETPGPTDETLEKIRRRKERAARQRLLIKRNRSQIKSDRKDPSGIDF